MEIFLVANEQVVCQTAWNGSQKNILNKGGDGRWAKKEKNKMSSWYPTPKKTRPGRSAQTPRAGTGDSVGWFRCYQCSSRINHDSNLSRCDTFLIRLLPPTNNRRWLPHPKETYDLNLGESLWAFSHFAPQQRFCVPKNCIFLVCFHPLGLGYLGNLKKFVVTKAA